MEMFRADLTEAVMERVLTRGLTLHHQSVTNLIDFKLFSDACLCIVLYPSLPNCRICFCYCVSCGINFPNVAYDN